MEGNWARRENTRWVTINYSWSDPTGQRSWMIGFNWPCPGGLNMLWWGVQMQTIFNVIIIFEIQCARSRACLLLSRFPCPPWWYALNPSPLWPHLSPVTHPPSACEWGTKAAHSALLWSSINHNGLCKWRGKARRWRTVIPIVRRISQPSAAANASALSFNSLSRTPTRSRSLTADWWG